MTVPETLKAIIRWVMRDVKYHKHYVATVQRQLGDAVDLLPDDPEIRGTGLSNVPIMYGLPGVSATVAPGTKMTLFFENGDPTKPRAAMWEGGHITLSFNNGVLPVCRVSDTVVINPLGLTAGVGGPAIVGTCTGTIVGPGAVTVLG